MLIAMLTAMLTAVLVAMLTAVLIEAAMAGVILLQVEADGLRSSADLPCPSSTRRARAPQPAPRTPPRMGIDCSAQRLPACRALSPAAQHALAIGATRAPTVTSLHQRLRLRRAPLHRRRLMSRRLDLPAQMCNLPAQMCDLPAQIGLHVCMLLGHTLRRLRVSHSGGVRGGEGGRLVLKLMSQPRPLLLSRLTFG